MLQGEHSAILSTFIKLPFVIKICVLSTFEWLLKTGFTVLPDSIDLGLINLCIFVKFSDLACAFTENMKIMCIHQCKWSDGLVVS